MVRIILSRKGDRVMFEWIGMLTVGFFCLVGIITLVVIIMAVLYMND